MKLYRVTGQNKAKNHYQTGTIADGMGSREAAERMAVALATQGWEYLHVEQYESDESDDQSDE